MSYGASTGVPVERSRFEIESMLRRFGADQFAYATEAGRAWIGFRLRGALVRIELQLPPAREFAVSSRGRVRSATAAQSAWAQACRSRWRALALVVKAKLVAIEDGITTFESQFMADLVLPDGRRVGDVVEREYRAALDGKPKLSLLAGGGTP